MRPALTLNETQTSLSVLNEWTLPSQTCVNTQGGRRNFEAKCLQWNLIGVTYEILGLETNSRRRHIVLKPLRCCVVIYVNMLKTLLCV